MSASDGVICDGRSFLPLNVYLIYMMILQQDLILMILLLKGSNPPTTFENIIDNAIVKLITSAIDKVIVSDAKNLSLNKFTINKVVPHKNPTLNSF